jgi:hypothetical protein
MSAAFKVELRGDVEAPWLARRAIAENEPTLLPSLQDDLSLLVTELVTNAVRHGGAANHRPLRVEFPRQADRIRVEVVDSGTDFEPPAPPMSVTLRRLGPLPGRSDRRALGRQRGPRQHLRLVRTARKPHA